jgi:hypothetical protein
MSVDATAVTVKNWCNTIEDSNPTSQQSGIFNQLLPVSYDWRYSYGSITPHHNSSNPISIASYEFCILAYSLFRDVMASAA